MSYNNVPSKATLKLQPFKAHISDEKLSHMKQLTDMAPLGPETYENQQDDRGWGVPRKWLAETQKHWTNGYDWRRCEARINSFPNYTTVINDDQGNDFTIHFVALFSDNPDAIPIAFYHGWPGNILEFLPLLDVVKARYTAKELPYHIIVPSLPGYAFSSGPPPTKNMVTSDIPVLTNKLMVGLGFSGYVAQGGDIGSFVTRQSAERFDECKAFHLNFCPIPPPKNASSLKVEAIEQQALPRGDDFRTYGHAYAKEHGSRTATIGHVLSSSPLALLAWIGEKFLEWTDKDPTTDEILDHVSLYWLTDTFPRCIYPYRVNHGPIKSPGVSWLENMADNKKPMGFSWFPKELMPVPISWVQTTGNLVSWNRHESGGHFAAMEKPEELWSDVEAFVKVAWKA